MSKSLISVQVGDTVLRYFGGAPVPMRLMVTAVTDDKIVCGSWEFRRDNGAEIDAGLGLPADCVASVIVAAEDGDPFATTE